MASHFKQLQRLLDDDTAAAPCFGNVTGTTIRPSACNDTASRAGLLQAALFYDPDRDIEAATSQPHHVQQCDTCGTGEHNYTNFAATDAKQLKPNADTPSVKGDRIHVTVMYEMADGDIAASSSQNSVAMIAQTTANPAATLRIPYRSLTANLQVFDNGKLHKIRAVCDSGAAQTAVSARWLRKHPELWDARIEADHRFHGVTGEPLHTDGVVRLTLCIANHYISVWAHVFVHMHADMLLGASSIIENALVIDGADKTIYPKMDPSQCAELSYKLEVDEQSQQLLIQPGSQTAIGQRLTHHQGMKIFKTPERMLLKQDTVILPSETADRDKPQALLLEPATPFVGQAHHRMADVASTFAAQYPQLEVLSACFSTHNLLMYMSVINNSDNPVTIRAGELVAMASRHDPKRYVTSNTQGHGRLEFEVRAPEDITGRDVTEATLKERGLDISNARDLGKEGLPLLDEEQHKCLLGVLRECHEVIAVDPKRPGTSDTMVIHLNTGNSPPQATKPYSIPYAYQELVRKEVEKLLRYGLISPCTSSWASPVLVVVKKDHNSQVANVKLATDLRKLNANTEMDSGSIGDMAEIVDKFNGKPYASVGDIASGYYNFIIAPEDRHKLAFVLPMSVNSGTTFCWNRAPYGVALLPAQFSRTIMTLLSGLHEDVSSFIDDLAVHTSTFERHLYALRTMFRRLIMAGLQLKGSKVFILPPALELLGYEVTPSGVRMQAAKTNKWRDFPKPVGKRELHSFLSAVSWYRRWFDNFSTVAAPLNDLLKKDTKWEWTDKHEAAFAAIKEMLQSDEAMGFPDFKDPNARFWLFTDASDVAVAAVLMQLQWSSKHNEYRPKTIGHFSKSLNDTQRRWAIYEKEAAAMMLGVTHWRKHLLAREFDCFVDSTVAMTMFSKQRHSSKMQRWGQLLQEYLPGMKIGFKRSADNAADVFTRMSSYSSYVPQPENELQLDDSLFDKQYRLHTKFRGTFDLLTPIYPIEIGTLWGVAADDRQSETIAACEQTLQETAQTDTFAQLFGGGGECTDSDEAVKFKLAMHNQFNAMRSHVHHTQILPRSPQLLALEQMVCTTFLSPVGQFESEGNLTYSQTVDHYAHYIEAFKAIYGHSPRILCVGSKRDNFALGVELAGCTPVIHEDSSEAKLVNSQLRVSRDPSSWGIHDVQAIHAYGDSNVNHAVTAASFVSAAWMGGTTLPTQVDHDGQPVAVNFDIHDATVDAPYHATEWRRIAASLPCNQIYAQCTEHSSQGSYQGQLEKAVMHGQLLSGQMIAVYMHRKHGMPLWTRQSVKANPSQVESLRSWATSGFMALATDAAADEVWAEIASTAMGPMPRRILQRVGEPPNKPLPPVRPVVPTLQDREEKYATTRARIFGDALSVDTPASSGLPSLYAKVPPVTESTALPRARVPEPRADLPIEPDKLDAVVVTPDATPADLAEAPMQPIEPAEQRADPTLQSVITLLQTDVAEDATHTRKMAAAKQHFLIDTRGLLCQRSLRFIRAKAEMQEVVRVVVPISRRAALMKAYHTSPTSGHRGHQVLYEQLSTAYYWRGMYSDCVDFVARCEVCAARRPFRARYAHEARTTLTPARPFHSLAIDVKGPLPTTANNNSYILVVVCQLTRFVVAVPIPSTESRIIAKALVDHVFSVHGSPYRMQVDNAAYFKSTVMQQVSDLYGIRNVAVLPYQPTANGTAEAQVKRVAGQLYRHSNALRSWDRYLQPLVHGLNATEVNQMGCSPFYALFGRDPVGLAELAWPDVERLDVDGDDFVTSLASNLRDIWKNIKQDTDARKRDMVAKANDERSKADPGPLVAGDYVWVEYGDDGHSKRLGKAGLPRRRRFKVLEYHPDRGYVKVDTDGLRMEDKVSVDRIMKAPKEFSVIDTATPLTKIEKRGNADMQLPPGWQQIVRRGTKHELVEYIGPGGDGRAKSVIEAWRKFNGDPRFMPQPRTTQLTPTTTPSPLIAAPNPPTNTNTTPIVPPAQLKLQATKLTVAQADKLCDKLMNMIIASKPAQAVVHGMDLKVALQANGLVEWEVKDSMGRTATTATELVNLLLKTASSLRCIPSDEDTRGPAVGAKLELFWKEENSWYSGTVLHKCLEKGTLLHLIRYDADRTMFWHDLTDSDNQWRPVASAGPSAAHIMLTGTLSDTLQLRAQRRKRVANASRSAMLAFLQPDGMPNHDHYYY